MINKKQREYLQRLSYRNHKSGKTAAKRKAEIALVRKYNLSK